MEEKKSVSYTVWAQDFIKKNILFVGLLLLGTVLIIVGVVQYFGKKSNQSGIEFISASNGAAGSDPAAVRGVSDTKKIAIDIEGSVEKPGVYNLPDGSRVQDGLVAAGGLSSNADREYVSKKINLAQKLIDSAKIYIPAVGEVPPASVSSISNASSVGLTAQNSDLVGINSASQSELEALPKIGPVTATKIISSRPYADISDLVSKKVLGQKTFDAIKDLISTE